jgi:hypothetical protein
VKGKEVADEVNAGTKGRFQKGLRSLIPAFSHPMGEGEALERLRDGTCRWLNSIAELVPSLAGR